MKQRNRIIWVAMSAAVCFSPCHLKAFNNIDVNREIKNKRFTCLIRDQKHKIMVYDAFARASIGHGRTGVAYLKIYNQTDQSDYLINVKSNIAEKSELHTHFHENGIMKMRQVKRIVIQPKETVSLEPGKQHVMFKNLYQTLRAGDDFWMDLVFETAGKVSIRVQVGSLSASNSSHKNCKCSKLNQDEMLKH